MLRIEKKFHELEKEAKVNKEMIEKLKYENSKMGAEIKELNDAINNLELDPIAIAQHKEWLFENIIVKEPLGIQRNKVLGKKLTS